MYCTYNRNTKALSRNRCCRGKAINIAYSELVSVALLTEHAMRRNILSSVASVGLQYISTFSNKRHYSRTHRNISNPRRTERDIIINVLTSLCKVTVILVRF